MARIDGLVKFNQVVLMELRLTLGGTHPALLARFAFMDGGGITYGESRSESVSQRSMAILEQLKASLEQDMVELLTVHPGEMSPEDEAAAEGVGNEFNPLGTEEDPDGGMSFR